MNLYTSQLILASFNLEYFRSTVILLSSICRLDFRVTSLLLYVLTSKTTSRFYKRRRNYSTNSILSAASSSALLTKPRSDFLECVCLLGVIVFYCFLLCILYRFYYWQDAKKDDYGRRAYKLLAQLHQVDYSLIPLLYSVILKFLWIAKCRLARS